VTTGGDDHNVGADGTTIDDHTAHTSTIGIDVVNVSDDSLDTLRRSESIPKNFLDKRATDA
jgi:hypothetical protein